MKKHLSSFFGLLVVLYMTSVPVLAQVATTGSISGTVKDAQGAFVPDAAITIQDKATGKQSTATTNDEGSYNLPQVMAGVYVVTIQVKGFKKTEITDVKVNVGTPATVNATLEVGGAEETVTIIGGGEVLQTTNATVGTTLIGRQITDMPTASRDALDLVLALPGTSTVGRPRQSSVNGLPKGAINITMDGVNVQDNLLKSNDGFFTYIRPRTDAISEVTVSTSTPGAESSAEGAVQIKFVTQGGSNEYHGGLYWYHRNPALNANYWFNNRDLAPDPVTHKAPQNRILLNQPGGKVGGPIWIPGLFNGRDKAFFFVNYEEFHLPERTLRTRTILSPLAQQGIFRFTTTNATYAATPPANVSCSGSETFTCSVNLFTLAANAGLMSTADPQIAGLLGRIRNSLGGVNALITPVSATTPNLEQAAFINPGGQKRKFPTVRFDFEIAKNHHFENIWNYQQFRNTVDFLNNADPAFPGFLNTGSQDSNRFSNTSAWRWTIKDNIVSEMRFGLTGGSLLFFPAVNSGQFTDQGGVALNINSVGTNPALQNPSVVTAPSRRNTPVKQFTENLNWVRGNHVFNFGGSYTRVNLFNQAITVVPTVNFGISGTLAADAAAFGAFSSLQPTVSQQANAAALYATLVGRISSITRNARLSEESGKYALQGDLISRAQQSEYGVYAQDTWRIRPNLTLTGGLRWEVQGSFIPLNNTYAVTSFAGLFGESGEGNLFKPGTLTGSPTGLVPFEVGASSFSNSNNNFAPSVGFNYSPEVEGGFLRRLVGDPEQTAIRGGFSLAFVREGLNTFQALVGANAASGTSVGGGTISATQNITGTPFPLTVGNLLRNGLPAAPAFPTSPSNPAFGSPTDSVNGFDPNLRVGYVESFTFGIQREIKKDNVIEVRYVGNRGHRLWRQYDLNEVNVIENGFLNEFKLAQQNVLANIQAGRGFNMRYFGPGTGTSPLPILLGNFGGLPVNNPANAANPANYGSPFFANATLLSFLNPLNPLPGGGAGGTGGTVGFFGFAGTLASPANDPSFAAARALAGIPINFFLANPSRRGGAFVIDNSVQTWYDAVSIEFRRRMTAGLLIQGSYTFSKALSNMYSSSSGVFDQPSTLRDLTLRKNVSPFDISHAFKVNFLYELPVGHGQALLPNANGLLNGLVGGWGVNGNVRIQSGSPFRPFNVQLVGMTKKDLQEAVGVYRAADGFVYVFPEDIRTNTFKAFSTAFSAAGASYSQGAPTGRYIAPAGIGNCLQAFVGGCGFENLVLKGPSFFRFDLSLAKKIKFTEQMNLELRGEFLNAFNNINFLVGAAGNDVNSIGGLTPASGAAFPQSPATSATGAFGRMTAAYQDLSTTNDPGGRLVQLVVRFTF